MANNVITALIIFVDIRGFSAWSEKVENFNFLDDFSDRWYGILRKYFEKYENDEKNGIKFLGDGAMIVYRIKENTNTKTPRAILADTLSRVKKSTDDFHRMCENFSETKGSKIPLRLGRGIVRGDIKQRDNEYIGAEINEEPRRKH